MTPCVLHFTCVTKSQSVYTEMTKKRKTFQEDKCYDTRLSFLDKKSSYKK